MATVLRVKRRYDDEPLDALVIAGKRRKTEAGTSVVSNGEAPLTTVLKFAGTLKNHEDDVVEHLNKTLSKDELKANYKQHVVDVTNKSRLKTKQESRDNRYKVVNYIRSIDPAKITDDDETVMTVIDVEHSSSSPTVEEAAMAANEELGYVYDLYYTQAVEDMHFGDDFSVLPIDQIASAWHRQLEKPDEGDSDSEDSNSESNWKNDYPDSDHSANSIDDEDMRTAVRNCKIDGESSDLSSEDDFVYAADEGDVEAYGFNYAKYKARVKAELDEEESSHSDISEYCVSSKESDDDEPKNTED